MLNSLTQIVAILTLIISLLQFVFDVFIFWDEQQEQNDEEEE